MGHCNLSPGQREKAWTQSGVNDWKHLSVKVKQHVKCSCHVENFLKLAFFGRTTIAKQLNKAHRDSIIQHNLEVEKTAIFCPVCGFQSPVQVENLNMC